MAIAIRQTTFTWAPHRESRSQVTARITAHLKREFDRIEADHRRARQLVRRQASPQYARNQQIVAAARQGVGDRDLGRQCGLPPQRVREIIRIEQHWRNRFAPGQPSGRDRHLSRHGASGDRDAPVTVPRTRMIVV